MRMLLTPYVQSDLGIVILKPGSELLPRFRYANRLLICDEPQHLKKAAAGLLPVESQDLAHNADLLPFLTNSKVVLAAGGKSQLLTWVRQKKGCQWHKHEKCHKELTVLEYDGNPIRLCWYHENQFRTHTLDRLADLAVQNIVDWVLLRISADLRLPEGHQLTLPEVCWWSVVSKVYDKIPEDIARFALNLPKLPLLSGEMKEADIKPYDDSALPIINERSTVAQEYWSGLGELDKPIICLTGDGEPPQSFMLRPKLKRWECEQYTRWVKTQSCCCCGSNADDPHHIIGYGMGGMGTKTHDLFTIPLCRRCHDALHADTKLWEQEHGSQIELLFRFLDRALGIGAILRVKNNSAGRA